MKKTFIDISNGLFLGLLSSAWLGYLIGLRLLNWNPPLWNNFSNIFGALFFTVLLYSILGILVGIFFTFGLKAVFFIIPPIRKKLNFTRSWIRTYAVVMIVLFTYLTITRTRPDAHVLIYDTHLVIAYIATLLLFYGFLLRRLKNFSGSIVKISLLPALIFLLFGFAASYFGTPKPSSAALGNPQEIADALSAAAPDVKVAVFGVDGAEWSVIDPLVEQGKMPVMQKLLEEGSRARFESLNTLKSPLIWASMATGKTPEKHGILDFGSFQFPVMKSSFINYPDGIGFYRLVSRLMPMADMPVTSTTRKVESIWDLLSLAGKTVGVAGWWATWPADPVEGWMISDRFTYTLFNPRASAQTLKKGQTHPPELLPEIEGFVRLPDDMAPGELSRFVKGDVSTGFAPEGWQSSGHEEWNPLYQLKLGYTAGESFFNASMNLIDREQPDFFTVYLEGNDMVSHFFWQYMDDSLYPEPLAEEEIAKFDEVVPRYYTYWDSLVGAALEHLSEDTYVFIVSDHGFGPVSDPVIPYRGGDHLPYGAFLAKGPGIKPGYFAADASVLDLTPTLLYLYNLPLADDMDGRIMYDIFTDEIILNRQAENIASYETGKRTNSSLTSSSADEDIKQQLRSLGYAK